MGQQVIKQPDGRFAIFSTNTDTINVWDATAEEIVEHFVDQAAADARRRATDIMEKVAGDRAREVYAQFTMTWREALRDDRKHDGEVHKLFTPRGERRAEENP